ncbi:Diacylglycerol acyltransferase/mycolyltransferase Ag85A precursor [Corynebacterium urogenitale]|uniref:Diacylglycerol acyltransferase/mycolyltransferase Ag85A n=1 Tax=Corynebacterium urogenitale TaxID=2487892 RepID=A0A5J6Z8L1_9CORY|nr:alpha/beta hydrolase family protein [Corynebacterium urogenitale]QFQ03254.1 Diacylglycerol acyltransferase/mycolyltransferase Ag85A precursor [Corynebacterium urogenitale]
MKRTIFRATAASLAVLAPVSAAAVVAPASIAQEAPAPAPAAAEHDTVLSEQATPFQPESKTAWRSIIKDYNNAGYDNVREISAYSEAMNRYVPLVLIQPLDREKRVNAPTLYLLNGADGGEGRANWLAQTDIIEFYGGNEGKRTDQKKSVQQGYSEMTSPGIGANVVIPMAGAFSYYTDWENQNVNLQGKGKGGTPSGKKQAWETFMTKELPAALESFQVADVEKKDKDGKVIAPARAPYNIANGTKAIAGMSMTGTTSLLYAEHNPGMYSAVGSFSGCAETTSPLGSSFVNITLNRGGANMNQMWGGTNTPTARYNDALHNARKLKGQENIYVSNGSGLAGKHDLPTSKRVNGNLSAAGTVIVEGGVIEVATNGCTHQLRNRTQSLNIPVTYKLRPQGTHQWGYWQDDTRDFWPVLVKGLDTGAVQPGAAQDPHHAANGGSGSSADMSSFNPLG